MASGVACDPKCKALFLEMKSKRRTKFLTFKITKDFDKIVVDQEGGKDLGWADFVRVVSDAVKGGEGRYAVYDAVDQKGKDVLVFITILDDDALKVKQKMLYTSSKSALKLCLVGVGKEWQVNAIKDLTEEELKSIVEGGKSG